MGHFAPLMVVLWPVSLIGLDRFGSDQSGSGKCSSTFPLPPQIQLQLPVSSNHLKLSWWVQVHKMCRLANPNTYQLWNSHNFLSFFLSLSLMVTFKFTIYFGQARELHPIRNAKRTKGCNVSGANKGCQQIRLTRCSDRQMDKSVQLMQW